MQLNSYIGFGNLTRDPDVRSTQTGKTVAAFTIAVNDGYGERQSVAFVDVECWEKTAEHCRQYLKKGSPVIVSGRIAQDNWEDKQTGAKRSKLKIVASNVQFLERFMADPDAAQPPARSRYADDDTPPARQPAPRPLRNSDPPAPDTGRAQVPGNVRDVEPDDQPVDDIPF